MKVKNWNFRLIYEHEGEEFHLVHLTCKYWLVDIPYIQNIKKNKFLSKNIMMLNTTIKRPKRMAESSKIGLRTLEMKAKEEDFTNANAKGILFFFQVFHIYTKIFVL